MLDMLKKECRLRRGETVGVITIIIGSYMFGILLLFVIMHFDNETEKTVLACGTLIAIIANIVIAFLVGTVSFYQGFNNAVAMGRTRKSYLAAYGIVTFAVNIIIWILITGCFIAEREISGILFAEVPQEFDFGMILKPHFIVIYAIVEVIVPVFAGAMILKYGKKAVFTLWMVWMILFLMAGVVYGTMEGGNRSVAGTVGKKIVELGSQLPMIWCVMVGIVAGGIAVYVTYRCIREQQII